MEVGRGKEEERKAQVSTLLIFGHPGGKEMELWSGGGGGLGEDR